MKCKKHPKYKVIRKPTADCQDCRDMWQLKAEIQIGLESGVSTRKVGDIYRDVETRLRAEGRL